MIRILVYVALVFAIAAGFAWLADRPGEIALTWQGYQVQTSLMVAAVGLAALFVVLAILWWLLLTILRAPGMLNGWFLGRRRDRGYRALSRGMIAIGAGDVKRARRYATESRKILTNEPLTLLLTAQTAQLTGDGVGARNAFEQMAADPETRLLGLRGLFVEAQRAGEHEAARHFAEEAVQAAPSLAWAGNALFDYQASNGEWLPALRTLGSNLNAKLIDRAKAYRLRGILLTARGMELESSDPAEARTVAQEAAKIAPQLVPAATLAARLYARNGDFKRAARVIEASWKRGPHPELAEAYAAARPGDAGRDRLKRAEKLAALSPDHVESHIAVARAAIDIRDLALARRELAFVGETGRTERFCLLMADIEDEEGDQGRAREWLSRAIRAPRDAVWMADGYVFPHWAPVSPVSGRLDAFEWRIPSANPDEGETPSLDLPLADDEPPALSIDAVSTPGPARISATETLSPPPPPDDPGIEGRPAAPVDRLHLQ